MNKINKKKSYWLFAAILSIVFAFLQYFDIFYYVDRKVMDAMYQKEDAPWNKIKIIKIDEKTLDALGPFGTWDRSIYGQLVNILDTDFAPSIIAFDITFSGNMDSKGDKAFANACRKAENVIVANNVLTESKVLTDTETKTTYFDPVHVVSVEQPYKELYAVTKQGFADAIMDRDGVIRHALKDISFQDNMYSSFASVIYQTYCEQKGLAVNKIRLDEQGRYGFAYSQKSGGYEAVSLIDVLDKKVDARVFKDSIVMIGAYAEGMQDAYYTPIHSSKQMYGVEIHANIVQALIQQKTFVAFPRLIYSILTGCIVFLFMILIQRCNMLLSGCIAVLLSGMPFLIGNALFAKGVELPLFVLPFAICICYFLNIVMEYLMEMKKRRELMSVFKRYVAPQVVDEVVKKEGIYVELGGETRDIAVLFVDIRGFTPLSEMLEAHEVVDILNAYLNLTSRAVFEYKGTLDKYIGDATMAVFNSPFDLDDYVYRAVCTALTIANGAKAISELSEQRYGKSIDFGIGVHCGKAVVGNIGSEFRMDFTAIGDTVNVAARLESVAKGGQIVISEEVKRILEGRIIVRAIGEVALKGKREKRMLYEVIGLAKEGEMHEKP